MIDAALLGGLRRAGLIGDDPPAVARLSGGVSCDVWKVEGIKGPFVLKRALPKLRVEQDWFAPVDRADSEVRWLRRAGQVDPRLVPEVLVDLPDLHAFALGLGHEDFRHRPFRPLCAPLVEEALQRIVVAHGAPRHAAASSRSRAVAACASAPQASGSSPGRR